MPHLNPIGVSRSILVGFVPLLALAEALGLHGEMHLVLEARILALRQEFGIVGDDAAQGLDPRPLVLGEIAEHVRMHHLLHAGMTDPDAHPAIVVADMRRDRAQPVVPATPPPVFTRTFAAARSISSWNT